jgi:DNA-binding LacI/PurR family transcriptional regulator
MDSIFVANDQMALGVLQVFHQMGIRMPEDIGIVGFDNIPEAAHFWPSLTTIHQDQRMVGKIAVQELIKLIRSNMGVINQEPNKSLLLDPILIKRESTRPKDSL